MKAEKHANNAILRRVIFKVKVESIAEADFLELRKDEVRRIYLPRTWVNKVGQASSEARFRLHEVML
jgi:hypothetical protein